MEIGAMMKDWKTRCARLWEQEWVRWLCGYPAVLFCGAALVYYWRVIYAMGLDTPGSAVWLTAAVCGVFSLVYGLAFLSARFLRGKPSAQTAVLIALAGLFFVFANPPLQAPDEDEHFLRAYSIGSGNFRFESEEDYPDDVDLLMRYFNGEVAHTQEGGLAGGYRRYARDVAAGRTAPNAKTRIQQLLLYLPQAAGVALGRACGANAMACMYLARAVNLLCYAALCGAALWFSRRYKALFTAVMLCPIALFEAASCSSDAMFLGLVWVFIGICLSDHMTNRRVVLLTLCFGVTFHAKYVTLALLPLLALLPFETERKIGKKTFSPPARRALTLGVALAGGFLILQGMNAYTALASDYGALEYFDPNIDPGAQLRFVFSHLPRYAAVLCYTLYRDLFCLFSMGHFGRLDVDIPFVDAISPLILLFAAGCCAAQGARETRHTGWAMGAAAVLTIGFSYTGMYLTSTPVTLPEINGVQARYLLPAYFALLVLAAMAMGRMMGLHRAADGRAPCDAAVQNAAAARCLRAVSFVWAIVSALLLAQRYYLGA